VPESAVVTARSTGIGPRPLLCAAMAAGLGVLAGCRNAAERRAADVAGLREEAAAGIVALEAYCTARDSVLAATRRAEPGAELALEQTLYAPDRVDDYCEEFRFHTHDDHEDTTAPSEPEAPAADSAAGDTAARGRSR
jgi:hypothetical protein